MGRLKAALLREFEDMEVCYTHTHTPFTLTHPLAHSQTIHAHTPTRPPTHLSHTHKPFTLTDSTCPHTHTSLTYMPIFRLTNTHTHPGHEYRDIHSQEHSSCRTVFQRRKDGQSDG